MAGMVVIHQQNVINNLLELLLIWWEMNNARLLAKMVITVLSLLSIFLTSII